MNFTTDTTDEEINAATRGYAVRFAKVASRFRKQLIEHRGEEKGSKIRYEEAFEICEYSGVLTKEPKKSIISVLMNSKKLCLRQSFSYRYYVSSNQYKLYSAICILTIFCVFSYKKFAFL